MSKYRMKNAETGYRSDRCMKCDKKLDPATAVMLELDLRHSVYHDFGGVPEDHSQGGFDFGPDCAELMRAEAREAMADDDRHDVTRNGAKA